MIRFSSQHLRLGAVALSCASLGAGASAIANAGASTTVKQRSAATRTAQAVARTPALRIRLLARRAVEGQFVVKTKSGFQTVTVARGTVQSVSGQQLTLAEGTKQATYRTVTLTLPATTKVRDNRQSSTLDQVQQGQRAIVLQGPNRALVIARTPPSGS